MKKISVLVLFLALLMTGLACAQNETAGVMIGDAFIAPGEKAVVVFGSMGFPEQIWSIRPKNGDKAGDYIKMEYEDYGLTISITNGNADANKGNLIKSIYIEKKGQKLRGIPFNIGDPYEKVKAAWGEPENKEQGHANFFKKGVMIRVNDRGIIDLILIQKPGKIDYDEMPKHQA